MKLTKHLKKINMSQDKNQKVEEKAKKEGSLLAKVIFMIFSIFALLLCKDFPKPDAMPVVVRLN